MHHLGASQLREHLGQADPPPLLLDVREPWEFRICHIAGSLNLPMGRLSDAVDDLDPQRETVVICHHGIRSLHVARLLEQAGFSRIINLTGGIDAWSDDIDPSMPRY